MSNRINIPLLPSWERTGQGYQLFRPGLGYLRIKPAQPEQCPKHEENWCLTLSPDLDGVYVGPPEQLATSPRAAELVASVRPGGHLHQQLLDRAEGSITLAALPQASRL